MQTFLASVTMAKTAMTMLLMQGARLGIADLFIGWCFYFGRRSTGREGGLPANTAVVTSDYNGHAEANTSS